MFYGKTFHNKESGDSGGGGVGAGGWVGMSERWEQKKREEEVEEKQMSDRPGCANHDKRTTQGRLGQMKEAQEN